MRTISQLLLTFLLNACWQVALVTLVAALCARLLSGTTARYRHLLWVTALAVSFGLPVLTSSQLFGRAASAGPPPPQLKAQPASGASVPLPQLTPADQPAALPAPLKQTIPLISISKNGAALVVALYLLFLCYRGGKLFLAWRRTRALALSAYAVELPEPIQAIASACQTALGVRRAQLLCSRLISVPITIGSRKPLVILPEQLLQEANRDVLTSAIGHELVHVLRRDYLLNLIYELISLPLSFHPATTLVRRRIRETRELGCDELVTERLVDAAVYARSLVQLAGAAVTLGRPTTIITDGITVGINDADILEERVMTILSRPKISVRRKNWLLIAATLVFVVPCAVAAPFALRISINAQDTATTQRQSSAVEPGTLVTWLKSLGETVERGDAIAEVKTDQGLIKVEARTSGVIERLLVQPGEKVPAGAALALIRPQGHHTSEEFSPAQQQEQERNEAHEARLKARAELEEHRQMEHEKHGWAITSSPDQQQEPRTVLFNTVDGPRVFTFSQDPQQEARQKEERRAVEARRKEEHARAERESQDPEIQAHRRAEREAMAKRQAELVKEARLTMQQAIQIANSQYPGTVLESRLVREFQDKACYALTILFDNGAETATTRVFLSAIDGSIIKAVKEER